MNKRVQILGIWRCRRRRRAEAAANSSSSDVGNRNNQVLVRLSVSSSKPFRQAKRNRKQNFYISLIILTLKHCAYSTSSPFKSLVVQDRLRVLNFPLNLTKTLYILSHIKEKAANPKGTSTKDTRHVFFFDFLTPYLFALSRHFLLQSVSNPFSLQIADDFCSNGSCVQL